ncbi:MmpS family transport accessory protein [Mycobacterium sp. 050134]|uniref:MmpS family transport accessory protein n=1 Tax=Mycobacterium sp. 050134 TaxID=3096111 RepID=UPI002EDB7FCE
MNDPRRPERLSLPLAGSEPSGPQGPWYPPIADPAYADQAPYAPTYSSYYTPQWTPGANDTKQLPAYWQQQDAPPPGAPTPDGPAPAPPGGPKPPRWLWIVAGVGLFLVVALVIALVLANDAIKKQTAVPPLPPMPEPTSEFPAPPPSIRTTPPSRTHLPTPTPSESPTPSQSTVPGAMQDVVYTVNGDGRAISIMYIGTGDVVQTEFNVALPWSKEVSLSKSAIHPANVTIVNFGHNVTCSVTIGGVQVSQRVGVGLTICDARG